jgi:maltodextrin utilization protein YvdJ
MKTLLYRIGGYDPQIIKAGRLGAKFLLPGLSLMIVSITSSWGGYHLAQITVQDTLYQIIFTIVFVSLILFVDFLLLQSDKKGITAFLRVLLAFSMGTLISVLTALSIYNDEIKAKLTTNADEYLKIEMNNYDNRIEKSDSLSSIYHNRYIENNRLAGRELYQGNPDIGSPAGPGSEYKRYLTNARNDSLKSNDEKHTADSLRNNRGSYKVQTKAKIEGQQLKGLNGRIENLYAMAIEKPITWFPLIVIFLALMVIDLMPISIKWGVMDSLDKKYEENLTQLREEKDADGNPRFYDVEKENFFIENDKLKAKIEKEKAIATAEAKRKQAVIEKLEETKKIYALRKLKDVDDKIQSCTDLQLRNDTQDSEITTTDNQNEETV